MRQQPLSALVVEGFLIELQHGGLGVACLDHHVAQLRGSQCREPLRVARRIRLAAVEWIAALDGFLREPRGLRRALRPLLVASADQVEASNRRPVVVVLEVPVGGERRRPKEGVPVAATEGAALEEGEAQLLHARSEPPVAGEFRDLRPDRVDGLQHDLDLPEDVTRVDVGERGLDSLHEAVDLRQRLVDLLQPGDDLGELRPVRRIGRGAAWA